MSNILVLFYKKYGDIVMWHECQKEFRGWCKAFTKIEILLSILEAALLVLCGAFLIFLILHLIACENKSVDTETAAQTAPTGAPSSSDTTTPACTAPTLPKAEGHCTWEPSRKTAAAVRHYADGETSRPPSPPRATSGRLELEQQTGGDGEDAEARYRGAVAALVRPRPPRDVAFGCTLAVVSPRWTLTAASCLEAIEEVDSLDDFVIAERFGGPTHAVDDVQVHPQYAASASAPAAAAGSTHDVAALRSATPLAAGALLLPTLEDYLTITLGERLTILGFGAFRSLSPIASERGLREVAVYTVSGGKCSAGGDDDAWSTRHLQPAPAGGAAGAAGGGGRCGLGALCAAVRWARGTPCGYCAGTPLVRARRLLGVMAAARGCGAHCDPALYTNVAAHRDWIDMLLDPD